MTEVAQFIEWIAKAFPFVVVWGGLLGFYYREKLKQVLARSLATEIETLKRQFALEALELNAKLQRDMESYKVSLIAEAERVKAKQEIRTSLALKIAEKRYTAISNMHDAHMGLDTDIGAHLIVDQSDDPVAATFFNNKRAEIVERIGKYAAAMDASSLFMPAETHRLLLDVRQLMLRAISLRTEVNQEPVDQANPVIHRLLGKSIDAEEALLQIVERMERIDDDT